MKISIRVFGRYKDITQKEQIELNVTTGNTLRDVVNTFVKHFPALEKDKGLMMVTKNKMYTSYETTIKEEDEITLSPPVVSGGQTS